MSKCHIVRNLISRLIYFRSEDDSAMVKDFVTCVRMHALAKDEPECTEERIVELIRNDYFKLNVLEKFTDIYMCIEGKPNLLSKSLPSRHMTSKQWVSTSMQ